MARFHPPPLHPACSTPSTWNDAVQHWQQALNAEVTTALLRVQVRVEGERASLGLASLGAVWHEMHKDLPAQAEVNPQPRPMLRVLLVNPEAWDCSAALQALRAEVIPPEAQAAWVPFLDWVKTDWPVPTPGWHRLCAPHLHMEWWVWMGDPSALRKQWCGPCQAHWGAEQGCQGRLPAQTPATGKYHPQGGGASHLGRVAVVGAGVAGSCTALALAQAGFEVHVLDAAPGPAAGASGNWAGAFHAHLTRGDSPLSQLTRLGCEYTTQALRQLTALGLLQQGVDWDTPGHIQTVPLDEAERTQETLNLLALPEHAVRWLKAGEVPGSPLPGLLFPQGGWVKTPRWVQANFQAAGPSCRTHWDVEVQSLPALHHWMQSTCPGPWVGAVLAVAHNTPTLTGLGWGRANVVKGQITRVLRVQGLAAPAQSLSGEAYAIAPPADPWLLLGATYERPVLDLNVTAQADADNRARFAAAYPQVPLGEHVDSRAALRFVWPDRLPVVGQLPGQAVWLNTAYASRGLTWAAMAGQRIAQQLLEHVGAVPAWRVALLDRLAPRQEWGAGV